jgi:hypothetical protein
MSTVSAATADAVVMHHAWCVTVDTRCKVAYFIDSKFERDVADVWAELRDIVSRETHGGLCPLEIADALASDDYRLHDLTFKNAQTRGACTSWCTVMNALVVGGVIDGALPKQAIFSRLSDDVILDAMRSVGNSVSTTEGFQCVLFRMRPFVPPAGRA